MTRRITSTISCLLLALLLAAPSVSGQQADLETNLKAAFLYNFTKYIDWPPDDESTFTIGIVGPSDLDDALKEIARGNTVDNKKIVIRRFDKPDQITPCQVLFISRRSKINLAEILARTGKGELTVAEKEGAARDGIMFNFVLMGDKLKFEVNTKALGASGLRVSSQLLRLAIVVS
jgi:hypothetical protein